MSDGSALKRDRHSRSLITASEIVTREERPVDGEALADLRPDAKHLEQVGADLDGVDAHRILARLDQVDAGRHHAAASLNTGSAR